MKNEIQNPNTQKQQIIKIIQFMGAVLILAGIAVFFDLFNAATLMNLTADSQNKMVGALIIIIGIADIFVIPQIIANAQSK